MKRKLLMIIALLCTIVQGAVADNTPVIWNFEDEEQFSEWTVVDADGDGHNWEYFSNAGLESGRMTPHEGDGLVCSASYDNETSSVLNPDNWLISPEVTLGGVLSFWACGQDESYCEEVFGIYVYVGSSSNPAPDDFVKVGADNTATGNMTLYEFDLSAYAGQTGRFAIRHYNCPDQFYLNIDDIILDISATYVPETVFPTNLVVVPTTTTADVTWDGAYGNSWNLRYRAFDTDEEVNLLWDITVANYETLAESWQVQDKDGDGYNWGFAYSDFDPTGKMDYHENVCFSSAGYEPGIGNLRPNNWLYSQELNLGGIFRFWAKGQRADYPDYLGVYVVTDEGEFQLGEDFTPAEEWDEYSFDTKGYEGKTGKIAIVHHNTSDGWLVYVDYISYEKEGAQPAEWTEVNGLTTPNYTIEGLTHGKDYLVQVQAYTEKGESDWTAPDIFTAQELSSDWTGSGTEDDPYLITNVLQMQKIASLMNDTSNPEHFEVLISPLATIWISPMRLSPLWAQALALSIISLVRSMAEATASAVSHSMPEPVEGVVSLAWFGTVVR